MLKKLLAHPAVRDMELDDPRLSDARIGLIQNKGFLRKIYEEWYGFLASCLPEVPGAVLELGSGGGFLERIIPGVIKSEVFFLETLDVVLDARRLPFKDNSLRAVVMTDVLHHIPDVEMFFEEAGRCVKPGGVIAAVEPWVGLWSGFVYTHLHHEPYRPAADDWSFPSEGPLSGANSALPWIALDRDKERFTRMFPYWCIERLERDMPFCYLVSGGVSMRSLMPCCMYKGWRLFEKILKPWNKQLAMFCKILLRKQA